MKYYKVVAKCGHVGKGKYVEVVFPVCCDDAKSAAHQILKHGKVKKQLKNAISSVCEISLDEYLVLKQENTNNIYLRAHCSQEVNTEILDIKELVFEKNKKKVEFETRREKITYLLKKKKTIMEAYKYEYVY